MDEVYLSNKEIQFLFNWFKATINSVTINETQSTEEQNQLFKSLKNYIKI